MGERGVQGDADELLTIDLRGRHLGERERNAGSAPRLGGPTAMEGARRRKRPCCLAVRTLAGGRVAGGGWIELVLAARGGNIEPGLSADPPQRGLELTAGPSA